MSSIFNLNPQNSKLIFVYNPHPGSLLGSKSARKPLCEKQFSQFIDSWLYTCIEKIISPNHLVNGLQCRPLVPRAAGWNCLTQIARYCGLKTHLLNNPCQNPYPVFYPVTAPHLLSFRTLRDFYHFYQLFEIDFDINFHV